MTCCTRSRVTAAPTTSVRAPRREVLDRVEADEVHDHALAERTVGHRAAGAARHERHALGGGPAHELHEIVRVGGHGDRLRDDARDTGRLAVDGAGQLVGAEDPAEARGTSAALTPRPAPGVNGRAFTRRTSRRSAALLKSASSPNTISDLTSRREIFTEPPTVSIAREPVRSRSVA